MNFCFIYCKLFWNAGGNDRKRKKSKCKKAGDVLGFRYNSVLQFVVIQLLYNFSFFGFRCTQVQFARFLSLVQICLQLVHSLFPFHYSCPLFFFCCQSKYLSKEIVVWLLLVVLFYLSWSISAVNLYALLLLQVKSLSKELEILEPIFYLFHFIFFSLSSCPLPWSCPFLFKNLITFHYSFLSFLVQLKAIAWHCQFLQPTKHFNGIWW